MDRGRADAQDPVGVVSVDGGAYGAGVNGLDGVFVSRLGHQTIG